MIYFGYTEAYASNVEALTVKMAGIPIYELAKTGAEYKGTALGPNMEVGTDIRIMYGGEIKESEPAQIEIVFAIYLLDEIENAH